ncbi:MAG TPA: hypothetical protein VFZ13_03880 [Gemmatimonadales bacterium]
MIARVLRRVSLPGAGLGLATPAPAEGAGAGVGGRTFAPPVLTGAGAFAPTRAAEVPASRSGPLTPLLGAGTPEGDRMIAVSRRIVLAAVVVPAPLPRRVPPTPSAAGFEAPTTVVRWESESTRALESVALPGAASRSEPATEPVEP